MLSHFASALFSLPTSVKSLCHVDVVHRVVEGAGVEDLALDQGGALDDQVGNTDDDLEIENWDCLKAGVGDNILGIVERKVTEISIALAGSYSSHWLKYIQVLFTATINTLSIFQ